jgi:hypothetical protein
VSSELTDEKVKDPTVNVAAKERIKRRHDDLLVRAKGIEEEGRGLLGGPSLVIRNIAPGGSESFQVAFVPGVPAVVFANADAIDAALRISLRDFLGRNVATSRTGPNPQINIFPTDASAYTVTIFNQTGRIVTYRLVGN